MFKKFIFVFSLAFSLNILAETVIYTVKAYPPKNQQNTKVIYLDQADILIGDLFGQLSSDPFQAQKQAISTIQSPDFATQQQAIADAFNGVITANNLGLEKIPAIVFDDKYVIYGTSDLLIAEKLYENMGR